jgi:isoleucyl-tRNA synthetase
MHPHVRTFPVTKLDEIALTQLREVMTEVNTAYQNYEFYKAVNAINRWINSDLSAFYLEAMKDRLYCGDGGGVLEEIFHGLLKMLSPITPNLVEEAWDYRPEWMKAEEQIHPSLRLLTEPIIDSERCEIDEKIKEDLPYILAANTAIKTAQEEGRGGKLIGSSLESSVILTLPPKLVEVFKRYEEELASIFVVSSVELASSVEEAPSENETASSSQATPKESVVRYVELAPEPSTSAPRRSDKTWSFSADFEIQGEKGSVLVGPPKDEKCARCWRFVAPDEGLCGRCEEVLKEARDDRLVPIVL